MFIFLLFHVPRARSNSYYLPKMVYVLLLTRYLITLKNEDKFATMSKNSWLSVVSSHLGEENKKERKKKNNREIKAQKTENSQLFCFGLLDITEKL